MVFTAETLLLSVYMAIIQSVVFNAARLAGAAYIQMNTGNTSRLAIYVAPWGDVL